MSEIVLRDFNIGSITPEQIGQIKIRLILLNTRPGLIGSEYIVTAFPENAKEKRGHYSVTTWPEVVLGIIAETKDDGNQTDRKQKSWTLHPTLRSGRGWRKKSIATVKGRDNAAEQLLGWTTEQNQKRRS